MTAPGAIGRTLPARVAALVVVFLMATTTFAAEQDFPRLSGRVTDAAGVLTPDARQRIEAKLKAHEDKTTDQLIVATVPSLQGLSVEDYANRLFRAWGLGEKAKNNGALLLVAPSERKVRIEVGYGLEGALTDALSKVIITTAITPKFKQGDFAGGIDAGIEAILSILAGDAQEWQRRAEIRSDDVGAAEVVVWFVIVLVLILIIWRIGAASGGRAGRGGGFVYVPGSAGGWSGGFSGGGGSDFSGGGGSSGGGGASGDW